MKVSREALYNYRICQSSTKVQITQTAVLRGFLTFIPKKSMNGFPLKNLWKKREVKLIKYSYAPKLV